MKLQKFKKLITKTLTVTMLVLSTNLLMSCIGERSSRKATDNLMLIMGNGTANRAQMEKYLSNNNTTKTSKYIKDFVNMVIEESKIEGVRADVVFTQIMKETNFLKFTGVVKESQNNFGGLGATSAIDPATGQQVTGLSFPDERTGIKANIQHLKAYASTEPLKQECVDPRFKYVERGCILYVEWLGIKENPKGKGWASDPKYGYDIVDKVKIVTSISGVGDENAKSK